jgi:DNA recombination protein RmuC
MSEFAPFITLVVAAIAAVISAIASLASVRGRVSRSEISELIGRSVREESAGLRQWMEEHARAARQEMGTALSRFQDSTLDVHTKFGSALSARVDQFAARLDTAVRNIDEGVAAIGGKLDVDIARMGSEAAQNREGLRVAIEAKLDDAATRQHRATVDTRQELLASFSALSTAVSDTLMQLGGQQKERLEAATAAISTLLDNHERGQEALRQELTASFSALNTAVGDTLRQMGGQQKERLETATAAISNLLDKHERGQEALRQTVEGRLDTLRAENAAKLEEMRATVDEKLKATLDTRLGESFNRVVEQLERVHKGIGEMQSLATNVGDLKNVLTNVKTRGTFGEVQLALLLEDLLSPDQFVRDAKVKENSGERVEFAVRMRRRDEDAEVLLPIDAKFPRDDYERLQEAADNGDAKLIAYFRKELEKRIRQCAKDISDKYICPPATTDWGILFLPTEGLYAEVLRQPGLVDSVLRDCRVWIAGPTTLGAILNAFRAVYRSIAIEKRSTEVWRLLGAIRTEFNNYNQVVSQIERQIGTAANSVTRLHTRTNVMSRKLKSVEALPSPEAARALLGLELTAASDEDEVDVEAPSRNVIPLTS